MSTFSRREIRTTRVEYTVPCGAYGACWVEVKKAVAGAIQEMRGIGLLAKDASPSDDSLRFRPGDDEVIVYFEFHGDRAVEGGDPTP